MSMPLAPSFLSDFIGQKAITTLIEREVRASRMARARGDIRTRHLMCVGPSGLGKSALASVLANESDLPMLSITGASFAPPADAFTTLRDLATITDPEFVLLVDEADGGREQGYQIAYSALTDSWFSDGQRRVPISPFWGVFTSNHAAALPEALKSRMHYTFRFNWYTEEELARIALLNAAKLGYTLTNHALEEIAAHSATPRAVNHPLQTIATLLETSGGGTLIKLVHVEQVIRDLGWFDGGLTTAHLQALRFLNQSPKQRGGLMSLSAFLGEDPRDWARDGERLLVRMGLVAVTGSGRALTRAGAEYLEQIG